MKLQSKMKKYMKQMYNCKQVVGHYKMNYKSILDWCFISVQVPYIFILSIDTQYQTLVVDAYNMKSATWKN